MHTVLLRFGYNHGLLVPPKVAEKLIPILSEGLFVDVSYDNEPSLNIDSLTNGLQVIFLDDKAIEDVQKASLLELPYNEVRKKRIEHEREHLKSLAIGSSE